MGSDFTGGTRRRNECVKQKETILAFIKAITTNVQSSERDAMFRLPVAQTDIRSRGVRTQSTRHAHTVEAQAHRRTHARV